MPDIVAVDLAAKYSAACLFRDGNTQPSWQADSWGAAESEFLTAVTGHWQPANWWETAPITAPTALVVEDLPHRLPFANLVKRVCRIQGRIAEQMDRFGALDKLLYVAPAAWRKHF